MNQPITGGCHCGAVRYEASGEPRFGAHCQCGDCRKFSGSGHKSFMGMPAEGLSVTGQPSEYQYPGGSGAVITHRFCPGCGAGLYSTHADHPALAFLYASALDDPERFRPQMAVYTANAPSWDVLEPTLPAYARGYREAQD